LSGDRPFFGLARRLGEHRDLSRSTSPSRTDEEARRADRRSVAKEFRARRREPQAASSYSSSSRPTNVFLTDGVLIFLFLGIVVRVVRVRFEKISRVSFLACTFKPVTTFCTNHTQTSGETESGAMKPVTSQRTQEEFWQVMDDFLESLEGAFPSCPSTKEWCLWYNNIVKNSAEKKGEGVRKWYEAMETPLVKGSAKYSKAVLSITGKPVTVYHAVAYKDVDAIATSSPFLNDLDLHGKLKGPDSLGEEDRKIFWDYMSELNILSYRCARQESPKVPTPDEIDKDIAQRKKATTPSASQNSLATLWTQLCETRGGSRPETSDVKERLTSALATPCGTSTVGDLCQKNDEEGFRKLCEVLPEVRGKGTPPDAKQWSALSQIMLMCNIESNVPAPMMKGIESVAMKLADDITSGKTNFADLDLESIGQQVLTNVDPSQIASFAGNIDKLMPLLSQMSIPGMPNPMSSASKGP
jgi:hypothetical protein